MLYICLDWLAFYGVILRDLCWSKPCAYLFNGLVWRVIEGR